MAAAESTKKFITAYSRANKYPLNLPSYGSNNGSLLAHRNLLLENAPYLFHPISEVPVLELEAILNPKDSVTLKQLKSDEDIASWLTEPKKDGSTQSSRVRCRFIFLQGKSGQSKLNISLAHAKRIFTYFQVMPSYVDFVSVFSARRTDEFDVSDIRFSSFRERVRLAPDAQGLDLPHLGVSGRGYQLSYNLKGIVNKSKESPKWSAGIHQTKWDWSTRQAVFHHQFDMGHGTTLWILTSARKYLQERVQKLVGQSGTVQSRALQQAGNGIQPKTPNDDEEVEARMEDRTFSTVEESFVASLSVHLLLAQYASEDWRGYLRWLEQMLESKTKDALIHENYNPNMFELTYTQIMEERANKAAMTLDANSKVLQSLASFYNNLMTNPNFELRDHPACKSAVADFLVQLQDYIYDTQMFSERAVTLSKITADRKSLVQEHLQARATDRVEKLTKQQQMEAKIMRVIAVLTLIYLPATFVSTFFSTDVVHYQVGDDDTGNSSTGVTQYSSLAMERWAEVTAPLTLLTFIVAAGWYYYWEPMVHSFRAWRKGENNKDLEKVG